MMDFLHKVTLCVKQTSAGLFQLHRCAWSQYGKKKKKKKSDLAKKLDCSIVLRLSCLAASDACLQNALCCRLVSRLRAQTGCQISLVCETKCEAICRDQNPARTGRSLRWYGEKGKRGRNERAGVQTLGVFSALCSAASQ